MGKDFLVYTLLLAAGLGTAYYASLPEEASSNEVSWIKIDPKVVTSLSFQGEGKVVEVTKHEEGGGHWVSYKEGKSDGKEKEGVEFKANEKVKEFLDWFNPLLAKRDVGLAKDLDLKEFELEEDKGHVSLRSGNKELLALQLGKRAYGSRDYFVLDKARKRVLLVSGGAFETITMANSRMMETNFFPYDLGDLSKVELQVGETTKVLDQSQRNAAGQKIWTDPGKEGEKAAYKNLVTKIGKLQVLSYGTEAERQALATTIPYAEMKLYKTSQDAVTLRFYKSTNDAAKYWVWSSFLGTYAEFDRAQGENLEKDIPAVVLD